MSVAFNDPPWPFCAPAIRFRAMLHDDLPAVMAIETSAYRFPWTELIMRDCIRIGHRCEVLERNHQIEAYGILAIGAQEAHLLNICVKPLMQRRGFARHLLNHLFTLAKRESVHTVFLEVRPSNSAAIALYRQCGFCEVGIRKNYYPAERGREDAIVMAKTLLIPADPPETRPASTSPTIPSHPKTPSVTAPAVSTKFAANKSKKGWFGR